jgi:hypothetical protein
VEATTTGWQNCEGLTVSATLMGLFSRRVCVLDQPSFRVMEWMECELFFPLFDHVWKKGIDAFLFTVSFLSFSLFGSIDSESWMTYFEVLQRSK